MRRLAFAVAMLLASPALAEGPSFDCEKATAPIERLICGDGELIRLDALLGETFRKHRAGADEARKKTLLAEQRDWLKGLPPRCGIATKGGDPDEAQAWEWAPCLAERYRERLAALGVNDPAPARRAGVLHPLCVLRAVGSLVGDDQPRPTPAEACTRGHRHIPIESTPQGLMSPSGSLYQESVTYRTVGTLPGGAEVVLVHYWGGGTGQFSSLYTLTRKGDMVSGAVVTNGGDRCNGGLESAEVVAGKTVRVSYNATPLDFVGLIEPNLPEAATKRLPSCAICCYGLVTMDFTPGDVNGRLVSASVDVGRRQDDAEEAERCLDRAMGVTSTSRTLSAEEARVAVKRFAKDCRK